MPPGPCCRSSIRTETPQAGLRAQKPVESTLRTSGIGNLRHYPVKLNPETLFEPAERRLLKTHGNGPSSKGCAIYVTGNVTEWRYKVGVDGEPAVGLTSCRSSTCPAAAWCGAAGGQTGYSRESLAGTAQQLVNTLLAGAGQGSFGRPDSHLAPTGRLFWVWLETLAITVVP